MSSDRPSDCDPLPVSIIEIAEARASRRGLPPPRSGADYAAVGFGILGGCEHCGASIACYNAYPSRSGYWHCEDCIGEDGYASVAEWDLEGTSAD